MEQLTRAEIRERARAVTQQALPAARLDALSLDSRPRSARQQEIRDIANGRRPAKLSPSTPAVSIASPQHQEFDTFGEFLLAVRKAGTSPYPQDPRLQTRAASGAGEKVPADGGYLVQPEFLPQIVERMYQTGEILQRCSEIPITGSNSVRFPKFSEQSRANGSRLGGVQVYWQDEASAATKSKPKFEIAELTAHRVIGLLYATDELAADAASLNTFTSGAFGQEVAFTLENCIVTGSGAGRPLGILNSNALVTVDKEVGQGAATIVQQNIVKMLGRLWSASRKNAVWIVNQELLPLLYPLVVTVGTGGSELKLFDFADGESDMPWDRLAGIPIIPVEHCPAVGQAGDIILADFSRYVVAMREDMKADVSIHVQFLQDEVAWRFVMRVDGQCIDSSPVTPLNGTLTTSPFVTLASRA